MCTKAPETKASVAGGAVAGGGGGGGMTAGTTGCVRVRRVFCPIEFMALSELSEVEVCGCGSRYAGRMWPRASAGDWLPAVSAFG